MTTEQSVSDHYRHGELLQAIEKALDKLGKTPGNLVIEDLAPVDEFHIGGRAATENLLAQLDFHGGHHVLDVGCGLGGAARFVADTHDNRVSGIDLTPEYIETGRALCEWVNLQDKVSLYQGSALSMPFEGQSFDGGYMLHVGMNIEDKSQLFREIFRVLRAGANFGIYDVMRIETGDLAYPVPWANDSSISCLARPDQYRMALAEAGFEISAENNRRDFAIEFFARLNEKMATSNGPPALGLHTLMQQSTALKITNMIDNIAAGYIAPVEIIVKKPDRVDAD
ncbi:MAG: class I SAM-dependent methyltransferase [Gammaproteobacteria bacterium]|nr:class I SAM-dependent methyltransferase [Gammaproteobacteria bacterium]